MRRRGGREVERSDMGESRRGDELSLLKTAQIAVGFRIISRARPHEINGSSEV